MTKQNFTTEHSPECSHVNDALKYAKVDLGPVMILLDAIEAGILYDAIDMARDETEYFDMHEADDNTPLKLVYGALMINMNNIKSEDALTLAKEMEGCSMLHITEKEAFECTYEKIHIFQELAQHETFIPFAAFMRVPFSLKEVDCAKTVTPCFADIKYVCEQIINRPFLLACREEDGIVNVDADVDLDVLLDYLLEKEKMLNACEMAGIVLNVENTVEE